MSDKDSEEHELTAQIKKGTYEEQNDLKINNKTQNENNTPL